MSVFEGLRFLRFLGICFIFRILPVYRRIKFMDSDYLSEAEAAYDENKIL